MTELNISQLLPPALAGERVILLPLEPGDHPALFEAASAPLIWAQHPEPDRYLPEGFQRYFTHILTSGGALKILESETQKVIGSSTFYKYSPALSQIAIGYTFLERRFWGGQFNGEVKRLMLQHAFTFVDRVIFEVGSHNLRSQAALKKIGAFLIDRVQGNALDGAQSDHLVFAIDRTARHGEVEDVSPAQR